MDLSSIPMQSTEQQTCQKGQSWLITTRLHETPPVPRDLQQTHCIISIIMTQQQEKKNMGKILGKISFSSNTSKVLGKKHSSMPAVFIMNKQYNDRTVLPELLITNLQPLHFQRRICFHPPSFLSLRTAKAKLQWLLANSTSLQLHTWNRLVLSPQDGYWQAFPFSH